MKYEAASMKTKRALAESLKKLMRRKPFSKITVTEIVADCGVNRKTFYYHFEDIYALLRWIFEDEALNVLDNYDLIDHPEEAIAFVFDYVERNRDLLRSVYDVFGNITLGDRFVKSFEGTIRSLIETAEERKGKKLPDKLADYLCEFLTEAVSGMVLDYITGRFPFDRRKTLDFVTLIMRTAIGGLINERGIPVEEAAGLKPELPEDMEGAHAEETEN